MSVTLHRDINASEAWRLETLDDGIKKSEELDEEVRLRPDSFPSPPSMTDLKSCRTLSCSCVQEFIGYAI